MLNKTKINFLSLRVFALVSQIFFFFCSSEGERESEICSACDEPHQSFYVFIVDSLGRPVNSLTISVKDTCGNVLFVPQSPIAASIGQYTLIDAEHIDLRKMSCYHSDLVEIMFYASDGLKTLAKKFTFRRSGGLCYCEYPFVGLAYYSGIPVLVF